MKAGVLAYDEAHDGEGGNHTKKGRMRWRHSDTRQLAVGLTFDFVKSITEYTKLLEMSSFFSFYIILGAGKYRDLGSVKCQTVGDALNKMSPPSHCDTSIVLLGLASWLI